ncbi:TetR/AcrR family transcriptional regulator [Ramlibacter sp. AW1]|uniref:TetR/AcrR family transcriptional regulator n=1 Tax=Ramlibacter aurantiacus TaxID=2801330 RepID=A0A937D5X6_9BURK|nr:TetR/AcrR family transcriptional regulator [Ramlibacter aurantiacus]MBL0419211.1 TetR/AcrR family transcriptional regulator [Ramlibacter aurantiacus]
MPSPARTREPTRARADKPATTRRGSGRPAADASVGREVILAATIELLRTRTPEQLSVVEVAAAAGVNRALVRYYFGDLKGLLMEATQHLMRQLQDRMETALRTEGDLAERVHHRLMLRLEFMREHPHFERLALSEIYQSGAEGGDDPEGTPLHRITQRGLELTRMLLDDTPHSRLDPRFVHLAILSVSAFLPIAQPLLAELFGEGPKADRKVDDYLKFVARMLADTIERSDVPPAPKRRGAA